MKRKVLGDEAEGLFSGDKGTPAEAVAVAAGGRRRRLTAVAPHPGDEAPKRFRVFNVKIFEEQYFAIQDAAVRRFRERGGAGKPDQSEVMRDILRVWLEKGV